MKYSFKLFVFVVIYGNLETGLPPPIQILATPTSTLGIILSP